MHAIIRLGEGQYYVSPVFGYYKDITAKDGYERYLQDAYRPYWIVWDSDRKRLIRWNTYNPRLRSMDRQLLIVDSDKKDWNVDDEGVGCVNFFSRELLDSFLDMEEQPVDVLDKCRSYDSEYAYDEIREVTTEKDIVDLDCVSKRFHDARISKYEHKSDGTLYLHFEDLWGCEMDVWLYGELEYDLSRRDPDDGDDQWWECSTIVFHDGFIYFMDDEDMTVDEIVPGLCYFRAKHMKYRVIPD